MNKALDLLHGLISEVERKTCCHEETHRGGAIWEICDSCGAKWADDEGGKPEFAWPESVDKARAFLATHPAVEQAGGDERAAFEQWLEQHMSHHFSPELDLAKYEDSGEYRYNPAADYWKAWQARAALAQPSPAQAEQAEAERPELWAVHAQGPDELYAAFTREDAEKHAAELNALPMPEGIAVGAVVVPSPWPAVQHWQYLAEQEQDHKNEIAGRLRQLERICEGLPQDAIDGGWTVQGIRGYAKRLEDQLKAALARVAELTATRNRYGVDAHYFNKNLQRILRDFESFTSDELARSLIILAKVADEKVVAQAQHSVPEGLALIPVRETEAMHDAVMALLYKGVARTDTQKLLDAYIAAAPGKEGV
ncbi:hypothetical protein [Pseudomonas aeruginosa]|uniref:hypothetical protein n=1 Tax=Pseudomonas aeruginosa TaxID=287 RepID=UPI00158D8DA7|nr:hypothetical protein [Pseudomonas aeruginosa]